MTPAPPRPKIYHITHEENLPSIIAAGGIWSDAAMILKGLATASIGMSTIKQRRLSLPVKCHQPDKVGEYVPFYFGTRSIMLYLIHMANHVELTYRGGQGPIVHLEADFNETVEWASANDTRWAFTLSNAGAVYTEFRADAARLDEVNWTAVSATDFRDSVIKEGKQAEFLLREFFPWALVRRIGVPSQTIHSRVLRSLAVGDHRPPVEVRREWYY
ncbi:MAG: DUF4433 domain-containing protein [Gemmatimonadaceae bacterium]